MVPLKERIMELYTWCWSQCRQTVPQRRLRKQACRKSWVWEQRVLRKAQMMALEMVWIITEMQMKELMRAPLDWDR